MNMKRFGELSISDKLYWFSEYKDQEKPIIHECNPILISIEDLEDSDMVTIRVKDNSLNPTNCGTIDWEVKRDDFIDVYDENTMELLSTDYKSLLESIDTILKLREERAREFGEEMKNNLVIVK